MNEFGSLYPEETAEYPDGVIPLVTGCLEGGITAITEAVAWDPDALADPLTPEDVLLAREEPGNEAVVALLDWLTIQRREQLRLRKQNFMYDDNGDGDELERDDFQPPKSGIYEVQEKDDTQPSAIGHRKAVLSSCPIALSGYEEPTTGKERAFFRERHLHRRRLESLRVA